MCRAEEPVSSHGQQEPVRPTATIQRNSVNLLIPNLGSTSLKYQVLDKPSERVIARGRMERVCNYRDAIAQISTGETPIHAVALKAVHAGPEYRRTVVVDDAVIA